jgi:hypothetical protein
MGQKLTKDFMLEKELDQIVSDSISRNTEDKTEEFYNQLKEFYNDQSYKERFKNCHLEDRVGIEIFRFFPNKKLKSKLLTVDLTGSLLTIDEVADSTHIAKVIKIPQKLNLQIPYKEGDLVFLSIDDTVGDSINPEYAFLMQFAQSNLEPKMDRPIQKTAPKFVAQLYSSAFLPPHEYSTPAENISTFAVEPYKILGRYGI